MVIAADLIFIYGAADLFDLKSAIRPLFIVFSGYELVEAEIVGIITSLIYVVFLTSCFITPQNAVNCEST